MSSLPLVALIAIFAAAGIAVWVSGIKLSETTDVLSVRFGFGEALAGLILLAFATNLPEIAITVSAALSNNLGIAVGNILGGIAIQTVVLVVLDWLGLGREDPLTYRAASLTLVLEAGLVIAVLVVVIMGTQLPDSSPLPRVEPAAVLIVVVWLVGLWAIGRARRGLPWHEDGNPPDGQPVPRGHATATTSKAATERGMTTARAALIFAGGAAVTLAAGVLLEKSGEAIAGDVGMGGVIFGSTFLAAATALPEVSTGLASVKLGDYQLAVSDILGGNAFLPTLFLVAGLVSGDAVLPRAHDTDIYLTALGALLTCVYLAGFVFRDRRQVVAVGIDSAIVFCLYALGLAGLIAIATT